MAIKGPEAMSSLVIGAAIEVHRVLGPGLLETSYRRCLVEELRLMEVEVRAEVSLPLVYKGVSLDCGYRMDLLVADEVIVELKCVNALAPIHTAQMLTYLRLSGKKVGLILNFYVPVLKDGIRRVLA